MRKVLCIYSVDKINFSVMHIKSNFQFTRDLPSHFFQQFNPLANYERENELPTKKEDSQLPIDFTINIMGKTCVK